MIAVLRAAAVTLDLDRCAHWLRLERVQHVWRIGDMRSGGLKTLTNGFTLLLADGPTAEGVVEETGKVLVRLQYELQTLVADGATVEVDFSLEVASQGSYSVRLDPVLLALASSLGVSVVVSAYPCD